MAGAAVFAIPVTLYLLEIAVLFLGEDFLVDV